ncbi:hypothetical protein AOQ84DRAFT_353041 [Glonium stellatum]|uniref:UBC core domain-containing protein n=1 Tax=Glonium stellatum TaxID=574774 RepID=A0A8E2JVS7_9PEZI|nr:hypothetical protein AOQ84DRAFT_353041 [Glonium stellatum]
MGFLSSKSNDASSQAYPSYAAPASHEVIDLTNSPLGHPNEDDDEASLRLAMKLDAEFKAEAGIADPGPLPYNPPRRAYSHPGPASLALPIDNDERLALQLQEEFDRENEKALLFKESDSSYPEAPNFTSEIGTPMDSVSFQDFTHEIKGRACVRCRTKFLQAETDLTNHFKQWTNGQAGTSSSLKCTKCPTLTCLGCGSQFADKQPAGQTAAKGINATWCCDRGKLFIIWVLLCGLDQQYSFDKQRSATASNSLFRRNNRQSGVGYGGDRDPSYEYDYDDSYAHDPWSAGTVHYGGGGYLKSKFSRRNSGRTTTDDKSKAKEAETRTDSLTELVMALLSELLPSVERPSQFDSNPPPALVTMLSQSNILNKAAELLRNDSLEDATQRSGLYQSMLDFVRALGSHFSTANETVFSERNVNNDNIDLLTFSFRGENKKTKGKSKDEKTSSIADCLRNLNIQSNMVLQSAKANQRDFNTKDSQQMLWLCRQISDLAEFLLANANTAEKTETKKAAVLETEGCLVDVPDHQILHDHHYARDANQMRSVPTGRMKKLIMDVTTLKTGLAPGIFVRYGTSRLDVMKILIVGPEGSPYEGGLFEFDLLCPHNYPLSPPLMNFRTTGRGIASFNPNLYPNGKVCLSLLGTWAGEKWNPNQSTLLQVFISIQAMIFCAEPWCNEPGRENARGSGPSRNYNKTIQALTVRHAMLGWLDGKHDPIWNDVVNTHFTKNADAILKLVNGWASTAPAAIPATRPHRASSVPNAYGFYDPQAFPPVATGEHVGDLRHLAVQLDKALEKYRQKKPQYAPVPAPAPVPYRQIPGHYPQAPPPYQQMPGLPPQGPGGRGAPPAPSPFSKKPFGRFSSFM